MRLNFGLIIGIMLALAGTLFSIIAFKEWRSTGQIIKNGIQTQGIVVDNVHRPRRIGENVTSTSLAPVVSYFTTTGQQKSYYSQTYTTPAEYKIGDTVNIWYLPSEPNLATLEGGEMWILPVAFGIFGFVMCLIGYPLAWNSVNRK
jgi:Protein of unknown function (DUF3592)